MEFLTLLKMLLGFLALIVIRAFVKNTGNFDLLLWLKYDFQRLAAGLILLLIVWGIYLLEPSSLSVLETAGLKISGESGVLIGFAVAGFTLWLPSNNPGS
ncbi:MAG TPA: hypothetical protein PKY82_02135 [Pyrinomonadaceae bacterium]|nr:hypothetical protein [Pyrinomonadaceae bacterium]